MLYNEITDADLAQLSDSVLFDYHYLGGYVNRDTHNQEKAISHFLEAKHLADTSLGSHSIGYMRIMVGLGEEYLEVGRYDDALATFQEGIVRSTSIRKSAPIVFSNLIIGAAECYEYKGWLNEVPQHLMDAWEFWPKDLDTFGEFGGINYFPLWQLQQFYSRYDMYDKALQTCDDIIEFISEKVGKNHPEIAEGLFWRGVTLDKMGKGNDAIDEYYMALTILSDDLAGNKKLYDRISGNLLLLLISMERWDESDAVLRVINERSEKSGDYSFYIDALYGAAESFKKEGTFDKALALNAELLKLKPSAEIKSLAEKQKNDIEYSKEVTEALPEMKKLYLALPKGSSNWFDIARRLSSAYHIRNDSDNNQLILKEMYNAIKAYPSAGKDYYWWTLVNLYGVCLDKENYYDALTYAHEKCEFVKADSNAPDYAHFSAFNDLVVAKLRANKLEGIFDDLDKAASLCLRLYANESVAYAIQIHNRGRAYQLQGKFEEAKQQYINAIALHIKVKGVPLTQTVKYLNEVEKALSKI